MAELVHDHGEQIRPPLRRRAVPRHARAYAAAILLAPQRRRIHEPAMSGGIKTELGHAAAGIADDEVGQVQHLDRHLARGGELRDGDEAAPRPDPARRGEQCLGLLRRQQRDGDRRPRRGGRGHRRTVLEDHVAGLAAAIDAVRARIADDGVIALITREIFDRAVVRRGRDDGDHGARRLDPLQRRRGQVRICDVLRDDDVVAADDVVAFQARLGAAGVAADDVGAGDQPVPDLRWGRPLVRTAGSGGGAGLASTVA